jgi:hypothetical protein
MTNLYCDGDSWSVSNNGVGNVMGYELSQLMGYKMENYGHNGKSIDKIIRSTQRHVLSNSNTTYMVGIGHTQRFDSCTGDVVKIKYPFLSMESELGVESVRINHFVDTDKKFAEQFLKWFEYPFLEYQTLSKLVMLHDFLKYQGVDFIIHNIGFDYYYDHDYEFGKQWITEVEKRPRLINFFTDSFHSIMKRENFKPYNFDQYKWSGHQEGPGHKFYANYLYKKWQNIDD